MIEPLQLDERERALAGVDASAAHAEIVPWLERPVGLGDAPRPASALLSSAFDLRGTVFDLDLLELTDVPRAMLVRDARGLPFSVSAPADETAVVVRPEGVAVDTSRSGPFVVTRGGQRIILTPRRHGLAVLTPPEDVTGLDAGDATLASLASGDDWLAGELVARFAAADTWEAAAGVGLAARVGGTHENGDTAGGALVPLSLLHAVQWAGRLPRERVAELQGMVDVEVDILERSLRELMEHLDPDDREWQADLLAFLTRRDDLESVIWVLTQVAGLGSTATIQSFDAEGEATLQALSIMTLPCEQLRRVSLRAPWLWWVACVLNR